MKVEKMKWITRDIVRANPDKVFLFGDNLERRGYGGQAKEMRGEPNTAGIPTKRSPNITPDAYMSDAYYYENQRHIDRALQSAIDKANNGSGILVIPEDGLGTGLAKLKEKAPQTWLYLYTRLKELETI